jgi:uncharacterized membrane protein YgaE (UPF0421/DUF939 family)
MSDEPNIETKRFELEVEKHQLEKLAKQIEITKSHNESIDKVLSVVKYLNEVQDETVSVTDEGFSKTVWTKKARVWSPMEEDLANVSLKSFKMLVSSIVPDIETKGK